MKYLFILLAVIGLNSTIQAQKKVQILIPDTPYDSLSNFVGNKVAQYIGQELWLKGMTLKQRQLGYANLIKNFNKAEDLNDPKNIYKCCDGYNSKYAELVDKHFLVLLVFKNKTYNKNSNEEEEKTFLKLSEISSGDIVYFQYDESSSYTFPFVVMGFLEKQRALLSGQKFVFANNILLDAKDIQTGKTVRPIAGDIWTCTNIDVDTDSYNISVFSENKNGNKIAVPLDAVLNQNLPRSAYTEIEAKEMLKKFGPNNYRRILDRKIASNMSKEALRQSWGEPLEIKKTGNTEEWIYSTGTIKWSGNNIIRIQ